MLVITDEDVDNEEVYKMANVMANCGGLHVMLNRYALFIFICHSFAMGIEPGGLQDGMSFNVISFSSNSFHRLSRHKCNSN